MYNALMKEKLRILFKSRAFKFTSLILSTTFLVFTFFIAFNPEPFLKFGYLGLFIFNIFSSGLFLLPTLIGKMNLLALVLVSALGMSVNESINWIMGSSSDVLIKESSFEKRIESMIRRYEFPTIFFLALIPFPFDIVGIVAGRLNISYLRFIIPILLARILRFLIFGLILLNLR